MQINNKKIMVILSLFVFLLICPLLTKALTGYEYLSNYTTGYWNFDNRDLNDSTANNINLTGGNYTFSSFKKIGNYAINFSSSTRGWLSTLTNVLPTSTATRSTCGWYYFNSLTNQEALFNFKKTPAGTNDISTFIDWYNNNLRIYAGSGGATSFTTTENWTLICGVWETGGAGRLYINGVESNITTGTITSGYNYFGVGSGFSPYIITGYLDELIFFYNYSLNITEVNFLYNSGSPGKSQQFPYTSITEIKNVTINANNIYNTTFYIKDFSLSLDNGSTYSTTNGTIYLQNYNTTNLINLTLLNATNHYNITYYNISLSSALYTISAINILNSSAPNIITPISQNYPYNQSINITWNASTSYINTSISSYNISLLNSDYSLNATINASNTGLNQTFNPSSYQTGQYYIKVEAKDSNNLTSYAISSVFNITSLINIRLQNAYTLDYSSNFSGYIISGGANYSFTDNNGTATLNIHSGLNQLYINSPFFSISDDNYFNFTLNTTAQTYNKTMQLYTKNSIYITIKDEDTQNLITENVTLELQYGNSTLNYYYTTNGTLFLENLTDGEYNLIFSGSINYTTARAYIVSVAENSTQNLNAYLSSSANNVIIVVKDAYSSMTLENASISLYRYFNSTLTLIEVKSTDITGRTQFSYTPLTTYRFIIQTSGYITKSFDLSPVLFSSYDVLLDRNIAYIYTGSLEDVKITFSPQSYYYNDTNNFIFIITSATGVLNNYGVNVSWRCGSFNYTGNNSIGETFSHPFNITCAQFRDTLNITYYYTSVGNSQRTYKAIYFITGNYSSSPYTFSKLRGQTYGMGILERIIIVILLALIVGGIAYIFTGGVGSLVLILLIFGYFSYVQFIPLWTILISVIAGFFLILGGSKE